MRTGLQSPPVLSWRDFQPLLEETVRKRSFQRKAFLCRAGAEATELYLVEEGRVHLFTRSSQGRTLTLNIVEPGDFFGASALSSQPCHKGWAQALTDGRLYAIPRRHLGMLLRRKPGLAALMIENLGKQIRKAERRLGDLAFKSVPQRLAALLLDMLEPLTARGQGPAYLPHRYTHQQMAYMVNSQRETVTRAFGRFRDDRLLDFDQRRIVLLDIQRLREIALR